MATPRDPLAASSYHDPRDAKDAYKEARKSVVDMALEMGYERSTMIEHGVHWADDLDQFRHMKSSALVSMWMSCGVRIFESFAEYLGSKFEDLMNAKGVICVSKNYTVNVLRQVTYPDSLIVATYFSDLKVDRFHTNTMIWSLKQQAPVAEIQARIVFVQLPEGKPADLVKIGGVYADLYNGLVKRHQRSNMLAEKWKREHPQTKKILKSSL